VLYDVSCPAVNACVAVGAYGWNGSGFEGFPFSERWNGSHWTLTRALLPAGASDGKLASISCTSGNACTAVGDSLGALVEHWNGTRWSIAALPADGTADGLVGISCPSPRTCEAVGSSSFNTGSDQPLTASYAAGAWTMEPLRPLAGSSETQLLGISCGSRVACMAVGQERSTSTGDLFDVYATGDGSRWTIASFSPALSADHGPLFAISCATAGHCLAVGSRTAERFG
jgi:hypothetical protein